MGGAQAALRRAAGGDVLSIRASAVRPSEASIFSNSVEYLSGLCVAGFPNLTAPLHPRPAARSSASVASQADKSTAWNQKVRQMKASVKGDHSWLEGSSSNTAVPS